MRRIVAVKTQIYDAHQEHPLRQRRHTERILQVRRGRNQLLRCEGSFDYDYDSRQRRRRRQRGRQVVGKEPVIEALFMRDYNMIRKGNERYVGVQGGFLVIRPSERAFRVSLFFSLFSF